MLNQDQASKRVREMTDSSATVRAALETYCGLCLLYAYGNQWGRTKRDPSGVTLDTLPTTAASDRTDPRLSMNLIRPRIRKIQSRLAPGELRCMVAPASGAPNDRTAAHVGTQRLKMHLDEISALSKLRRASLWRVVVGSAIVRRTLGRGGPGVTARSADGQASGGQSLATADIDWDVTPPYEWIRDAAANSPDFAGEDCVAHEKVRPLSWAKAHFPGIAPTETKATMGQLLEYQKYLYAASGETFDAGWFESRQPAVIVGECWFRDDEADRKRRWPWWGMYLRDALGPTTEARWPKFAAFGENPYRGLPLTHLIYEEVPNCPWGRGVPIQLLQAQDAVNIAWTNGLRSFIAHCAGKLRVHEGALVEGLSNNPFKPIIWRGAIAPDRLPAHPLDQTVALILNQTPEWMDRLLNLSPVQSGESAGRGTPAKAYRMLIDQADTEFNAIIREDEERINELLRGTLTDLTEYESLDAAYNVLSGEFSMDQVAAYKAQDADKPGCAVKIVPDTLRARTPDEMKEEAAFAVNTKMVEPTAVRLSLLARGIVLDALEADSWRKQELEMTAILAGEAVPIPFGQNHPIHMRYIEWFMDQPRWDQLKPNQQQWVMDHWSDHNRMKLQRAAMEAQAAPQAQAGAPNAPEPAQPGQPTAEPYGAAAGGSMPEAAAPAGAMVP